MAKNIASDFTFTTNPLEFQTRAPIRAIDWRDLSDQQNFLRSRLGDRLMHVSYDTPFDTTSTNFTQSPDTAVAPLSTFYPTISSFRPDGSSEWQLTIEAYMENLDLRVQIENESGTKSHDVTVTGGSGADWYSTTFTETSFVDGERWDALENSGIEVRSQDGTTGRLWQVALFGKILTASDL